MLVKVIQNSKQSILNSKLRQN